jgi:hypothetical protein
VKETGRFYGRLCHMQGTHPLHGVTSLFYALPLPGTPLYVYGQKQGVIGISLDAEEEYLLNVGALGAEKLNYPNLNGSKFLDVVWWDRLAQLEALKEFYRLEKEQPLPNPKTFMQTVIHDGYVREQRQASLAGGIRVRVLDFLHSKWILGTPLADPVIVMLRVKSSLQYLYRKYLFKAQGIDYNLFKKWPEVKKFEKPVETRPIKLSLRTVVNETLLIGGDSNYPDQIRKDLSIGL